MSNTEPLGIQCPHCGSTDFEVERVKKRLGSIDRTRRCTRCRADLPTREVPRFPVARRNSATGSTTFDLRSDLRA